MAYNVKSEQEYDELLKNYKLVVVDYWGSFCQPCKAIAPQIDALADKYDNILVIKCEFDELPEVMEKAEIEKLPTLKFFLDGEAINTVVGTNMDTIKLSFDVLSANCSAPIVKPGAAQSKAAVAEEETTKQPPTTPASRSNNPLIPNQQALEAAGANCTGSNKFNLPPRPAELTEFSNSLVHPHTILLFTKPALDTGVLPQQNDLFTNKPLDILKQTVKDLQTLTERFGGEDTPIEFRHIIISPEDPASLVLAEEYGCTVDKQLPIIKLMWKGTVFETITQGFTLQVEDAMPNFMQL